MARAPTDAIRAAQTICQHPRPQLKISRSIVTQQAVSAAKDDARRKPSVVRERQRKTPDQNLFLDILNANASKRDARSYLANFTPVPRAKFRHPIRPDHLVPADNNDAVSAAHSNKVLGSETVESNGSVSLEPQKALDDWTEPARAAIVLLKLDHTLQDDTLECLGRTLSQLSRLGMSPIVVVQCYLSGQSPRHWHDEVRKQMVRVVAAIETGEGQQAQVVEDWLVMTEAVNENLGRSRFRTNIRPGKRRTLLNPIERGAIPVIAPLVFNPAKSRLDVVASSEVVLALVRDFVGANESMDEQHTRLHDRISLDRLIILDSHGGLPRSSHGSESHVFVNLRQEYDDICAELKTYQLPESATKSHSANIRLANDALALLPSSSSAIISSHASAAASSTRSASSGARNPLIHNLLTDKPLFSSSLPHSRLLASDSSKISPPTLLKRGMPVQILPSPHVTEWAPPSDSSQILSLTDPALDLPRLVDLIEDSFGRPLDGKAYFARIAPVLAGIIMAGEYDGCAILTWEPVPGHPTAEPVPYLDKLAVRRASQGAGGVADILFNAMVRDCFPRGVVWRSRSSNPVNGWYFERAQGSYRLPQQVGGTNWTMFWTTQDVAPTRFEHYAEICGTLGSFWKDGKGAE